MTKIYANYEDFCKREDKSLNGMTIKTRDELLKNCGKNDTNTACRGCWNCIACSYCDDCIRCTGCEACVNCRYCNMR